MRQRRCFTDEDKEFIVSQVEKKSLAALAGTMLPAVLEATQAIEMKREKGNNEESGEMNGQMQGGTTDDTQELKSGTKGGTVDRIEGRTEGGMKQEDDKVSTESDTKIVPPEPAPKGSETHRVFVGLLGRCLKDETYARGLHVRSELYVQLFEDLLEGSHYNAAKM